jgi:hypothetical protein
VRRLLFWIATVCLGAVTARADVAKGIYRGSSQTTVKFLDPISLQVQATRKYSRKLTVTIGRPLTYTGTTESNPFRFVVAPTMTGGGLVAGDFFTASARTAAVGGRTTLLQYWLMQNNQSGFTGSFVDAHAFEGVQRDRVVVPLSNPEGDLKPHRFYDASFGQTFQVTASALVSGANMTLTIKGYAHVGNQAIVSFETAITATKR